MTALLARWYPHLLLGSLCAGLAAGNLARPGAVLTLAAGGLAVAAAVVDSSLRAPLLAAALLATGWWWSAARLDALDDSALAAHVGKTARTVAVVSGPPRRGTFTLRIPAEVRRFGELRVHEPVLLLLPLGRAPPQGTILKLIGTVKSPRPSPSGFDERTWLRRQGISVVVDGVRWSAIGRRGGLEGLADRLRRHIETTMAPGVGGERGAVLAGVVLGADEGLPRDLRDDFRASGLYHLLAVSGQNVAFIALGVLGLAWIAGIPRWLGELGVLAVIGAYTLAVGWQPSVVRAAVAGAVASLAWLSARPRDRWYTLLLGVVVLLAWNPYSLFDPGFELSFAAVVAIFVGVPRLERVLEGYPVPPRLGLAVVVATVCGVATAPILWLRFGAVPLYSVPANAMAELSVGPLLGVGLIASAIHPLLPGASAALGWIDGWLAAYLALCARLWASLPGAQVTSGRVLALASLAFSAVPAALWLARGPRVGR